ncbi:hypothetical protein A1O1_06161 [Capronia coronata CBS 617.96]|uniref:DUF7371 domain-containing protein n=1 Tax=Capronia coronata CBS 617.96 TaxID=1182541 RepID=W9XZY5_9EURO|nr:uncharacterized protein A1O1_06161 [Capronia coronata CBS 617.96]EXJ85793.1 hypothetical protein A1O1_06161 [Capronia coronata CBS 617.96]
MRLLQAALLVGAVAGACEGAILPIRHASPTAQATPACSPVTIYGTVTITEVVAYAPPTITILQQDPSSQAKYMASVDTDYVMEQSQLAPVSNSKDTRIPVFTQSVFVSGYEATEVAYGNSVFYLSDPPSYTGSSYTPEPSILAEVITVTVLPFSKAATTAEHDVETSSNGPSAFASPSSGWNITYSNSSILGTGTGGYPTVGTGAAGSSILANGTGASGPRSSYGAVSTVTLTNIVHTITQSVTVNATSAPASGYIPPNYGYGSSKSSEDHDNVEKRQTCVWITATIDGQEVGWCNNWDGSRTLTYTSWETTTTPTYIPGIGTIAVAGTTPSGSAEPTLTIETSTPALTQSSPSASASACGQVGPFEIGFDDLPAFSPVDNNTADFPPVFNPYDHFFWGDGWAYVPPPNEPYPPQSGDRLAQFIPSLANNDTGSPDAGLIPPSSFGCGPRNYDNRYWFTARSAYVGCDNGGQNSSSACDFVATSYQWDNTSASEVLVATQHFKIPPCPDFKNCQLTKITFNYLFYKMTTLSFYANVHGRVSIFWLDSLDLNWYNNTCAAGLTRISSRKIRL